MRLHLAPTVSPTGSARAPAATVCPRPPSPAGLVAEALDKSPSDNSSVLFSSFPLTIFHYQSINLLLQPEAPAWPGALSSLDTGQWAPLMMGTHPPASLYSLGPPSMPGVLLVHAHPAKSEQQHPLQSITVTVLLSPLLYLLTPHIIGHC